MRPRVVGVRYDLRIDRTRARHADTNLERCELERLREPRQMLEIEIRIRVGAWIAPRRSVDTDGPHESAQAQLTRAAHAYLLVVRQFQLD